VNWSAAESLHIILQEIKIFSEKLKGFGDGPSYSTSLESKETRVNAITQRQSNPKNVEFRNGWDWGCTTACYVFNDFTCILGFSLSVGYPARQLATQPVSWLPSLSVGYPACQLATQPVSWLPSPSVGYPACQLATQPLSNLYQPMMHMCHETFKFMMSYLAMSLGVGFWVSRKVGTGGGGWVYPKVVNSTAMSGLACEKAFGWSWVGHFFPFKCKWTKKTVLSLCIASNSSVQDWFFC